MKRFLNQSLLLGLAMAAVVVGIVFIDQTVARHFPLTICSPQVTSAAGCQNQNAWLVIVDAMVGVIVVFGGPVLLGVVLAVWHGRRRLPGRSRAWSLAAAMSAFMLCVIVAEVLMYRPWVVTRTPAGEIYSPYALNAIYGSPMIIVFLLLIILAYALATAVRRIVLSQPNPISA